MQFFNFFSNSAILINPIKRVKFEYIIYSILNHSNNDLCTFRQTWALPKHNICYGKQQLKKILNSCLTHSQGKCGFDLPLDLRSPKGQWEMLFPLIPCSFAHMVQQANHIYLWKQSPFLQHHAYIVVHFLHFSWHSSRISWPIRMYQGFGQNENNNKGAQGIVVGGDL